MTTSHLQPPAPARHGLPVISGILPTAVVPAAVALAVVLMSAPPRAAGQSVLNRPPNMQGTWTGQSGTLYFNFMHRFTVSDAPVRKVTNYPTFLLGAGLPSDLFVGARYASNSELVRGIPNEWEFFARWGAFAQSGGAPLDVTLHAGYNHAARSADAEVTAARRFGDALRVMAAGRYFSDAFDGGKSRFALAGGATVRVTDHVALAGDYARLTGLEDGGGEEAWSAGVQLAIPYTPHTLSIQATNATTTTLQGASIGIGETRWGFEFTVPITLSRYFGGDGEERESARPPASDQAAAVVGMTNQLTYTPDTVRIGVGETIRWTNGSDLLHTVTADPERAVDPSHVGLPDGASPFDSGNLAPGESFERTFTVPGEYTYFCVPHVAAGMVGTIIVTDSGP